ncbi:MAG: alkene reductase [Smithellaceae bacterium]|nr:alkene reductase [Smithellaceae bacterium]
MTTENALLKPIRVGPCDLPNRVFMAPMTRSRAANPENAPTLLAVEYYTQRAGAGLIVSEGSQVSRQGVGYIDTPGIYSPAQVEGWKRVTQGVHKQGGHIFCQIWHCGRISHPDFHDGDLPVAPSAINPHVQSFTPQGFKDTVTPRALSVEEIHAVTEDFRNAALNAVAAGFDGVEIHSANGYLFHQFFSNCSNVRTDAYGGSHANKARFFFETVAAVGKAIGFDRTAARLNPCLHGMAGIVIDADTIPTFEHVVKGLSSYPQLAYLHLLEPAAPMDDVPGAINEVARHFRPLYKGVLVINRNFAAESGRRVIEEGSADAVAFGKPFISNPDLVERIRRGASWAPWNETLFYGGGAEGYTDYPTLNSWE